MKALNGLQNSAVPQVNFRAPCKQKAGLEILDLGDFYQKLHRCRFDPAKPHRISYYCFIYISHGVGGHFVDFKYHHFQSGSFIFINQEQVHAFDIASRAQGKMINVTADFFDLILAKVRLPFFSLSNLFSTYTPLINLSDSVAATCNILLNEINKTQQNETDDPLLAQLLFSSLLMTIENQRHSHAAHLSDLQAQRFNQFRQLVSQGPQQRCAAAYAQRLHMSYKSLNQLCRHACGLTAKQLIDNHTILEAKRRLAIESAQVQEIAYQLGFDEVTYFVKFFKRHTHLTPSQFRAQHDCI
ncbi:AraC family transcriptional regulator [Shewanella sp. Scap07]|uniref:AraC family transcriptional regulator n=1 Tax=Shewanella sp. Scap07 TaxID=2589987 RepID=UPI0015BCCD78|nr:helix-turn-helix transcriptional regulator [Shewanella sp. Scap07]QLE87300.1 AraC family transcriptional regulator [Shewanella sp. Scap07]